VRREAHGSHFSALRSTVRDLVQLLRAEGCCSIGVLAGSLAAVPALRLINPETEFSACAFVAPLFEASISVTRSVRHCLMDDADVDSLDDAIANVHVPVLVVHGARDEVVPLWQIDQLRSEVKDSNMVERCVIGDEGHIFQRPDAWQKAQCAIEEFFGRVMDKGLREGLSGPSSR
jgi:pimeloyl-ACP methyl ester carboxylesterase